MAVVHGRAKKFFHDFLLAIGTYPSKFFHPLGHFVLFFKLMTKVSA
ncbi:hypothetical protein FRUB_06338 [Fimbriiglobus ruber]|uniref:Uncharacterized protein n=1 Tax=Fimbriiglobus ruber TaxID=1908690 RepID=A0A225DBV9_9BACT|nr:hypothetical protein FRUB_06338 [Fimbriiglobus ruber]